MKIARLANDLWEADIALEANGRVIRLMDRTTGALDVTPPETEDRMSEGGHRPFGGLECWPKQGDRLDSRADVISTFSPLRGHSPVATELPDGVSLETRAAGWRMTMEWRLPPGDAPLRGRATMANESAPGDPQQFEGFFRWNVPGADWPRVLTALPGGVVAALRPFGEMRCDLSESARGCAAWWVRGTERGVAIRPLDGVRRFYRVVQNRQFVLGPHSERARLTPGQSVSMAFEVAPLTWARAHGWVGDLADAERLAAGETAGWLALAERVGPLHRWVRPGDGGEPTLKRRILHLTFQYQPVDVHAVRRLLERVVAPAGFNQVMIEVGRAFPYRSHPRVTAPWAWDRRQWNDVIGEIRALGLDPIPQFNALGHQPETGLTRAYPELSEDPAGWCLCTRHPDTLRILGELFDELIEVFRPSACGIGLDEIDLDPVRRAHVGRDLFGSCPRCRDADGGDLFAEHILGLHSRLKARGMETLMWADMLLHEEAHPCCSGRIAGTWRAVDRLPRDLILVDWCYAPVPDYGGSRYLTEKGFHVLGATWHEPRAILEFARFAADRPLLGMVQTTWTAPTLETVPLPCVLWAGRCFLQPRRADMDSGLREAEALALQISLQSEGSRP